jgi:hypothetical protein
MGRLYLVAKRRAWMAISPARRDYPRVMTPKKPASERGVKRMTERERSVGLDAEDEAARWLAENDSRPEPLPPKAASKSKALHRWRNKQG